jgi:hydroxyacylglutathione hydrolase
MNKTFNTVVGSLVVDETTPLVLIIDEDDVEEAVRDLIRIGYDNVAGFATVETLQRFFAKGGPSESIEEINFEDLEALRSEANTEVVDVRFRSEYDSAHVPDARNASYTRLPEYEADLPTDKTLLVHCGSGARAAAATAFLRRTGRNVKYVNDAFDNYAASKEPVTA